jgi:hypothetical protein
MSAAQGDDTVAGQHAVQADGALVVKHIALQRLHPRFKYRQRKRFQAES